MEFINFCGHRRTADRFLEKIRRMSGGPDEVVERLRSLSIYDAVTPDRNKIALDEASNRVRMRVGSDNRKSFSASFPNIFGHGETVEIDCSSGGDCMARLGMPFLTATNVFCNKIEVNRFFEKFNDKTAETRRVELSTAVDGKSLSAGVERVNSSLVLYTRAALDLLGFSIAGKAGSTLAGGQHIPFLRLTAARDLLLRAGCLFAHSRLKAGRIIGKTNLTEKFFLGPEITGYKDKSISPAAQNHKVGGKSFVSLGNRVGLMLRGIELYAFGDIGVTSAHGFAQCYDILKTGADSICIGKSVGLGVALAQKRGVSFFYSIPLTRNTETEKYGFNVDIKF